MKSRILQRSISLVSSVVFLVGFSLGANAQRRREPVERWERLGMARVEGRRDHDLIRVNTRGRFRGIQLRVQGAAVEFQRVVVHFENGADTEVEVRDRIQAGGQTRVIDLPGDERRIRTVEVWYGQDDVRGRQDNDRGRRDDWRGRRATLYVYGRR